jgi:hypothetical protein
MESEADESADNAKKGLGAIMGFMDAKISESDRKQKAEIAKRKRARYLSGANTSVMSFHIDWSSFLAKLVCIPTERRLNLRKPTRKPRNYSKPLSRG